MINDVRCFVIFRFFLAKTDFTFWFFNRTAGVSECAFESSADQKLFRFQEKKIRVMKLAYLILRNQKSLWKN